MRLPAYLCNSRHGIYYVRFPLPQKHPGGARRAYVKFSLRTRDRALAMRLGRRAVVAGQDALSTSKVRGMSYEEMRELVREHFQNLLNEERLRLDRDGHDSRPELGLPREWMLEVVGGSDEADEVEYWLTKLCEDVGIPLPETKANRDLFHLAYRLGLKSYTGAVKSYKRELERVSKDDMGLSAILAPAAPVAVPGAQSEVPERRVKFSESVAMYFEEKSRTDALAVKTERGKRDAFSLLSEITGDKPLAEITKADAREVKQVVMRLPKNRLKNPKTRDKTLFEMLEVEGVELLSARSV